MRPESIDKIDQLLEGLENTSEEQLPERRLSFLNRVCDAVNLPCDGVNLPYDVLFNPTNGARQQRFIAVCLLRLLCRNEDAIWENMDLRRNTFEFFDNQIDRIYHSLDITKDDHNHEKLKKLRGTEEEVLEKFDQITNSILNLGIATAHSIRTDFMRALSVPQNKLFLEQFVTPSSLTTVARLGQIFEAATVYNESSMEDRFGSYENIETVFDPFLRDAKEHPSIFTERCVIAPIEKIYDFIHKDFQNQKNFQNNETIRTTIAISPLDHKYPFHEKDRKIELKFLVENKGPGYTFGVQIECDEVDEGLTRFYPVNLGTLSPNQSSEIILETTVKTKIKESPIVMGKISWWNFDRSESKSDDFIFKLTPQREDIDWDTLKLAQPYSLEAIKKAENLVGRTELIGQLSNRLLADEIESSIINGQKRVGKTSIAEVVQANFAQSSNYSVIFVPIIELNTTTPDGLVADLGERIVEEVSYTSKSFSRIETPRFASALSPLSSYFRYANTISPDHKFIIILDEFDEIHPDMVQINSSIGRTFFNNIRAMSSTGYVGFILVGGENMQIIRESTDQLNKMSVFQVDYFDKGQYWPDFQDLVRRPVEDTIEFNDAAINALYEMTEGHPFYTKLICSEIYKTACNERNAYITKDNVEKAVQVTIKSLDLIAVSHFWTDGISKRRDPIQQDEIQTHRRKFLIAFAQIKRRLSADKKNPNREDLQTSEILDGVPVDRIIDKYITRGFLIEEKEHYRWKPRFFERWLIERGFSMLTGEFLDEEAVTHLRKEEEKAYVPDTDILNLCNKWGLYRGSEITPTHVRAWLEQFEYNTEQKLIFNLLKHVRFYKEAQIREKIRDLHRRVQQNVAERGGIHSADRRVRRSDILLSSFGPPSKSESSYARIYAAENRISVNNVVQFDYIPETLQTNEQIKAIVFVDDIIGSGGSTVKSLNQLNRLCGSLIRDEEVKVFILAICGLHIGTEKLEDAINRVLFDAEVIVSDCLTQADQCFTDQSKIFNSSEDQNKAEKIAREYGRRLQRQHPIGYNENQLLVTFDDNCPNNTLPILWKESTGKVKWTPLFKRN